MHANIGFIMNDGALVHLALHGFQPGMKIGFHGLLLIGCRQACLETCLERVEIGKRFLARLAVHGIPFLRHWMGCLEHIAPIGSFASGFAAWHYFPAFRLLSADSAVRGMRQVKPTLSPSSLPVRSQFRTVAGLTRMITATSWGVSSWLAGCCSISPL